MSESVRSRLLWGKAALQGPKAAAGLMLWHMAGLLLPSPAAWSLAVVVLAGLVASVLVPRLMVRLLWWAWTPARGHGGRVLLSPIRRGGLSIAGPHHLVAARGIPGQVTPESLSYGRAVQRLVAHRLDVAVALLALPWEVAAAVGGAALRCVTGLPLVGWAWRVRFVVAGIAVAQTAMAGHFVLAAVILVLATLSYVMPWWRARWLAAVHRAASLQAEPVANRPAAVGTAQPRAAADAVTRPAKGSVPGRAAAHDPRGDRLGSMHRRHRRIAAQHR